MKTLNLLLAIFVAAFPAAADPAGIDLARKALDAAIAGDYETFSSMADDTVRQAVSRETLASIAGSLELQFGRYLGVTGVDSRAKDPYQIYVFSLDYERAVVKMMVALNPESRVSGLRIVGADEKVQWKAPEYADPSRFTESDVRFGPESSPLPGTLSLPNKEGKAPAVVLLHGSGPNDRDETIGPNKIFRDLAWGLASRGVAVLRFEKRTREHAQSFDVSTASLDSEVVDDAIAAVSWLRSRPEIDPSRVFVLGHSLGGLAAPYVARRDGKLAGTIVIAGPGRPMLDVLAYQLEHLAKLNGAWNDEAKVEVERVKTIAAAARKGQDSPDEAILGMPARYWIELDRRNGPATAAESKAPILVIQGGRDYQVTGECFAVWEKALGGKRFATLVELENLNHLMMAGEGPSKPAEYQVTGHVDEKVVTTIADWISGR